MDEERAYLASVWAETHNMVREGMGSDAAAPGVVGHPLNPFPAQKSIELFLRAPRELETALGGREVASLSVFEGDCVDVAIDLARRGYRPLLMDAGSRAHFGGGYENGARAQEEELCRRSNLAEIMDPQYGQENSFYPLPAEACIYVPNVSFFRHGKSKGYRLLEDGPVTVAVGIIAAFRNPTVVAGKLRPDIAEATREMLSNFFHVARCRGNDACVCVALGCGAYRNPVADILRCFDDALADVGATDKERPCAIRHVAFAVFDDANAEKNKESHLNPHGNFAPFATHFGSRGATVVRQK